MEAARIITLFEYLLAVLDLGDIVESILRYFHT